MDWKEGKIVNTPLERQMKTSYIDYAMSVIVTRALPDVRDGLKPVHRRIETRAPPRALRHARVEKQLELVL